MGNVDDIEDVIGRIKQDTTDISKNGIVKQRRNKLPNNNVVNNRTLHFAGDSFVPGTKSVYMKTWGCSHNSSDSEYMAGLLTQAGYTVVHENENYADLWLLNSCTVKTPSETQLMNGVLKAVDYQIPVVVAGCVSQAAPTTPWLKNQSLVGVQQIDRIVQVVEETLKGNSVRLLSTKRQGNKKIGGASLSLPKIRKNPLIEILAINTGCLNHCTYCKTKKARGDLASYPIDQLVERARQSFEEGVKEIWLTSEDLGAYGRDIDLTLPDLLTELVKVIPDGCRMRLGMTNPPYILDHLDEIAVILNHEKVYAFLHIPVQSGNDSVLSDMRREYTNADFCLVVDFMLKNVPGISIATDVICAFPTETEEDFKDTWQLISKYKFPSVFINRFYPRPGTPAAKMKCINTVEAKRRTKLMTDLFHSYHPYEKLIGSVHEVLVSEIASDEKHLVGHTKSYEQVLVPNLPHLMGKMVKMKIVSASKFSMVGQLLDQNNCSKIGHFLLSLGSNLTQNSLLVFILVVMFLVGFLYRFNMNW